MTVDYFTYDIAEHWLPAIENEDYTALDDDEIPLLEEFLDNLPRNAMGWEWGEDTSFTYDDISGLMAQCVQGKLYIKGHIR